MRSHKIQARDEIHLKIFRWAKLTLASIPLYQVFSLGKLMILALSDWDNKLSELRFTMLSVSLLAT